MKSEDNIAGLLVSARLCLHSWYCSNTDGRVVKKSPKKNSTLQENTDSNKQVSCELKGEKFGPTGKIPAAGVAPFESQEVFAELTCRSTSEHSIQIR